MKPEKITLSFSEFLRKKTENVKQRKESDVTFVKDLLDCVFDMKLADDDVTQMYRLGRWDESKFRPLLVSFKKFEQKESSQP